MRWVRFVGMMGDIFRAGGDGGVFRAEPGVFLDTGGVSGGDFRSSSGVDGGDFLSPLSSTTFPPAFAAVLTRDILASMSEDLSCTDLVLRALLLVIIFDSINEKHFPGSDTCSVPAILRGVLLSLVILKILSQRKRVMFKAKITVMTRDTTKLVCDVTSESRDGLFDTKI